MVTIVSVAKNTYTLYIYIYIYSNVYLFTWWSQSYVAQDRWLVAVIGAELLLDDMESRASGSQASSAKRKVARVVNALGKLFC